MNKTDLIGVIAKEADIPKATARRIVRTVEAALLSRGKRAVPRRRTPTAKAVKAKFKPGKALRDAIR
jgi:nucleoid DNA-binding protein